MRSSRDCVLLYAFGGTPADLPGRVKKLGYEPILDDETCSAAGHIAKSGASLRAALIPAGFPLPQRGRELEQLARAAGSGGIRFVAVGERPGSAAEQRLREHGVRLCLGSPFHDRELRFVLNRALFDPTHSLHGRDRNKVRHELRAPTSIGARVIVGGREKPAQVYSLSVGGCYLETLRPTLVGASVEVALPLPEGEFHIGGRVVLTNVPGNLERLNLPHGMAVEFFRLPPETREAIQHHVHQRARSYEL
jgi:PilZ domain